MADQQAVSYPPGTNTVDFHRRQFLAERIGWLIMALTLSWALLGGFGEGWLSKQHAWNRSETLQAAYERYGRRDAPHELRLRFEPKRSVDRLVLHLNRAFVDGVRIERVTPEYDSMVADRDGASLVFAREPAEGEYSVIIEYKPRHAGPLSVAIHPGDGSQIAFNQFIYP